MGNDQVDVCDNFPLKLSISSSQEIINNLDTISGPGPDSQAELRRIGH